MLSLRRRNDELFERMVGNTCPRRETGFNFAKRIIIHDECIDPHYSIQYPCAIELNLRGYSTQGIGELMSYLNFNIPLSQITHSSIIYSNLNQDDLIKILYDMPNVDYLSFYDKPFLQITSGSAKYEAQISELMIKSKITKLKIGGRILYTLDEIEYLVKLCLRLEYLEFNLREDMLEWIAIDFLTKKTTPYRFSCYF
jgi:hypothetical protein